MENFSVVRTFWYLVYQYKFWHLGNWNHRSLKGQKMRGFAFKILSFEYFGSEISKNNIFLSLNPTIHFLSLGNRQELKIGDSWAHIYPTQKIQNGLSFYLQNQAFKSLGKLELIKTQFFRHKPNTKMSSHQ